MTGTATVSVADLIEAAGDAGYAEGFADLAAALLDALPDMADRLDLGARRLCRRILREKPVREAEIDLIERAAFDAGCAHALRDVAAVIRTALQVIEARAEVAALP